MALTPERIVLVTGASRGIGAEVALRFATPGTHVIVHYREKSRHAESIADTIRDLGGQASTLAADLSTDTGAAAMVDTVAARFGRLDALVLNASGGFGGAVDPGYAMRLNRDAQKRLATLAMPLMPTGARIVYVTSHQAHFFPDKAVPKGYAAVAVSKRAGETALYAMRPDFERAGIHLTVVSGDMIDGTTMLRLLQRRDPELTEARRAQMPLPAVDEFASAIVSAATTASAPGTVYVGGADYLMTA
ncbi:MAG: SDR family oxidoreductase [Actinomycetota bacterium]|nr:SDR family oxidoreductase [Actinomycetota bacterium]